MARFSLLASAVLMIALIANPVTADEQRDRLRALEQIIAN